MRYATAGPLLLALLSTHARAEPPAIDQYAWLNYAIVVTGQDRKSDVSLLQRGTMNGISSVQFSGDADAQIRSFQKGNRNTAVIFQSGWNVSSSVTQGGQEGFAGYTDLPTTYWSKETDDGYLSYFMTGGFSLAVLGDANHAWFSRFGRAR